MDKNRAAAETEIKKCNSTESKNWSWEKETEVGKCSAPAPKGKTPRLRFKSGRHVVEFVPTSLSVVPVPLWGRTVTTTATSTGIATTATTATPPSILESITSPSPSPSPSPPTSPSSSPVSPPLSDSQSSLLPILSEVLLASSGSDLDDMVVDPLLQEDEVMCTSQHPQWQIDLVTKFLLPLSDEDRKCPRLFCFLQEAFWYYLRNVVPSLDPHLIPRTHSQYNQFNRSTSFLEFAQMMLVPSLLSSVQFPMLFAFQLNPKSYFNAFIRYQAEIPVCGTVILSEDAQQVLLVTGPDNGMWTWPKGKINHPGEDLGHRAHLEVLEELGIYLDPLLFQPKFSERIQLYVNRHTEVGRVWHALTLFIIKLPKQFEALLGRSKLYTTSTGCNAASKRGLDASPRVAADLSQTSGESTRMKGQASQSISNSSNPHHQPPAPEASQLRRSSGNASECWENKMGSAPTSAAAPYPFRIKSTEEISQIGWHNWSQVVASGRLWSTSYSPGFYSNTMYSRSIKLALPHVHPKVMGLQSSYAATFGSSSSSTSPGVARLAPGGGHSSYYSRA